MFLAKSAKWLYPTNIRRLTRSADRQSKGVLPASAKDFCEQFKSQLVSK